MIRKYLFIACLIAYISPCPAIAQSFRFRNYGVNEGLPSSETYHVMQDSQGYMWISTDHGVARFNGYEFKTFTTKNGLPDNVIFESYEDPKGRIWFRSLSGKLSYWFHDSVIVFPFNDRLYENYTRLKYNSLIESITMDQNDCLWLGTYRGQGLISVSLTDGRLSLFKTEPCHFYIADIGSSRLLYGDGGTQLQKSKSNNLAPSPVFKLDREGKICDTLPAYGKYNNKNNDRLKNAIKAGDGYYYYSLGPLCQEIRNGKVISEKDFGFYINNLYRDSEGGIWISVLNNGVHYYSKGNLSAAPDLHLFKGTSVSSVCYDREHGYWFSTTSDGIYYLPNKDIYNYTVNDSLQNNKILSVCPLRHDGIALGYYHHVVSDVLTKAGIDKIKLSAERGKMGNVTDILRDSMGHLWFAGALGISVFEDQPPYKAIVSPGKFSMFTVSLTQADSGQVWALLGKSLMKLQLKGNTIEIKKHLLTEKRNYHMLSDVQKDILIGGTDGLYRLEKDSLVPLEEINSVIRSKVLDLARDKKGRVWLVTEENGIYGIRDSKILCHLSSSNGMLSDFCSSIFIDSTDRIWVGSGMGVSCIRQLNGSPDFQITNYTEKTGLASNEVNQIRVFDGRVYVATNGGLSVFDADGDLSNRIRPEIYITSIKVNNTAKPLLPFYDLNHDENFLMIDFLGLTYKDAGRVQYKYRLEGVDTNWIYTQYQSVQYPTLTPGDYVFSVSAMNNDGVWNDKPASISIHISPPWWETWWFRGIALIAIAGFVYWRIKTIEKREREKTELNKQIAETELKALRAQMNPHFIFNAINSIQHFIMKNEREPAYRYLSKFSKLIRNVLDNSRKQVISIEQEIATLELYIELELLRFEGKNKFEYLIEADPEINREGMHIPSMLIQPYVENAIWHGLMNITDSKKQGKLLIKLELLKGNALKCIVEDNGVGRQKAMEYKNKGGMDHKSVGMQVTKERLDILKQTERVNLTVKIIDLMNETGENAGTRIEIIIPLAL